jgi:hypothetical protein
MLPIARCGPALLSLLLAAPALPAQSPSRQSAWVHYGPNGRLVYEHLSNGDRITDFSYAGYGGGGIALPKVPTHITISPTGKADDTPVIQAALDAVAKLKPNANNQRGAVQLAPGIFHLAGTLHINASGIVLRGTGASGKSATTLQLTGEPHLAIEIKGDFHQRTLAPATMLTDAYVPAGSTVIHVTDASSIRPGDTLLLMKPVTPEWIHFMGMDQLTRDGQPEVWLKYDISVRRRVASVRGNAVTLEVPLTDSFDSRFYPGFLLPVTRIEVTGLITEVGVEDLRITAPARAIRYDEDPEFDGIQMDNIADSWLRTLAFEDTTNSVRINLRAKRLTITDVDVVEHKAVTGHAKPFDFSLSGSQILLNRCTARGNRVWYVATQSQSEGPIVALHCRFTGNGDIEPHQRWSTGFLIDNCEVQGGGIQLKNRGELGSGHGWTIGWSVSWNNKADYFIIQNPPGAANWSIGDRGEQQTAPMPVIDGIEGFPLEQGIIDAANQHVKPASLYLEQLKERLGPSAVRAIDYR